MNDPENEEMLDFDCRATCTTLSRRHNSEIIKDAKKYPRNLIPPKEFFGPESVTWRKRLKESNKTSKHQNNSRRQSRKRRSKEVSWTSEEVKKRGQKRGR